MSRKLTSVAAPALPFSPTTYSREYQDTLNNILRLYFLGVDNTVNNILGDAGGQFLASPYGAFQDSTTQTITANTAKVITFNTTDFTNEVALGTAGAPSTSRIYVTYSGIYNIQWSGQFQNTDTKLNNASVWMRINNSDVPGSTGYISIPNSHAGGPGHSIESWNYFLSLNAGDYFELWWSSTNDLVTIQAYAAGTAPTRPTTASVIATVSFVSRLP